LSNDVIVHGFPFLCKPRTTGKTHPVAPAIAYAPGFHVFTKPVRMKVMSEDVKHKFDAGGVLLNIEGADGAKKGYD
jgi:acyl-CoA synthetase (NDP forming)